MSIKDTVKSVPVIGEAAQWLNRRLRGIETPPQFTGSKSYWEDRYRAGGTSGAGSYNRLAEFKAEFLNAFVADHGIASVIEFGSGDGAQLKLARYPHYTGVDVSHTVLAATRAMFAGDPAITLLHTDEVPAGLQADLALSLDVIYHLVEDTAFLPYMAALFDAARRYVIVYASNEDRAWTDPHVRHRAFTRWVETERPDFVFVEHVPNRYPFDEADQDNTSFADFYIFERTAA